MVSAAGWTVVTRALASPVELTGTAGAVTGMRSASGVGMERFSSRSRGLASVRTRRSRMLGSLGGGGWGAAIRGVSG
ncbi:hypothetical protein ACN28E_35455 [Archangium lansingense]|uniref:hypothetical protein n=1 Tax=Archangium lansingense TaxID=2995310 RepID=UPI003B7BD358